jgi:hypothetical protein
MKEKWTRRGGEKERAERREKSRGRCRPLCLAKRVMCVD